MLTVYLIIYWIKLKNLSVYKKLLNNWLLVSFFLVLVCLLLANPFVVIIIGGYGYYLLKKERTILYVCVIVSIAFLLRYYYFESQYYVDDSNHIVGYIKDVKYYKYYQRLTVKSNGRKYYIYDYDFIKLNIGDRIDVEGQKNNIDAAHIEGGFDYQKYLKHNKVYGVIRSNHIYVVGSRFDIGIIRQKAFQYLHLFFNNSALSFLKAIILGDSTGFTDEFQSAVKNAGITHLFAISGLHIGLLVIIINYILRSLNFSNKRIEIIIIFFLLIYMILVNFSSSIIRAVLLYISYYLNKKFKFGFTSLDLLSIIFLGLLIYNPYNMYQTGFVLSFLVTFTIMVTSPIIGKAKHLMQIFYISLFSWLITLPIIINLNNEINILSPAINVFYIELVTVVILPVSLVVFLMPILSSIYQGLIDFFIKSTLFISRYFSVEIRFPDFTLTETFLYYLIIWCFIKGYKIKQYKYIIATIYLFFLFVLSNAVYFKPYAEVVFLDLYNGESILISDRYNKCNVLIDTGDGTNSEVTGFLKRKGIKRIDYLIITHNHIDHNGEAFEIINNFNVNNIVVSAYDNSELSAISNTKVKTGDQILCGNFIFHVLHPDMHYTDENDNSIVLYVFVGEYYFLFLGDVSKKTEEKIAKMGLDVDVVKIAHHGSSTSTSTVLLAATRPRYAIIQTGRIEQFGFPAMSTIETLKQYNIVIYRTDEDYSIKYKYYKKKSIFITNK